MGSDGDEYLDKEGKADWKKFFNRVVAIIMATVVLYLGALITGLFDWAISHIPYHPGQKKAKSVPAGIYGSWTRITDANRNQYIDISPISDTAFYLNEHQENPHVDYTLAGTGHFYEKDAATVLVNRDYMNKKVDLYYLIELKSPMIIEVKTRPVDFSTIKQAEIPTAEMNISGAVSYTKVTN